MATRRTVGREASVLASLTLVEKGELLDHLLTLRPELGEPVEEVARLRLVEANREAVAADVEWAISSHDIDEINGRAGYHPGRGYVGPGEAADEILDEDLQRCLDDLARRAELGLAATATELATGILCGLYACREAGAETLLEYTPDFVVERAGMVIDECVKLGVALPVDDLVDLVPEWGGLLHKATAGGRTR